MTDGSKYGSANRRSTGPLPVATTFMAAMGARDTYPAALIRDRILAKGEKALVIYGVGHLGGGPMLKGLLDATASGRDVRRPALCPSLAVSGLRSFASAGHGDLARTRAGYARPGRSWRRPGRVFHAGPAHGTWPRPGPGGPGGPGPAGRTWARRTWRTWPGTGRTWAGWTWPGGPGPGPLEVHLRRWWEMPCSSSPRSKSWRRARRSRSQMWRRAGSCPTTSSIPSFAAR